MKTWLYLHNKHLRILCITLPKIAPNFLVKHGMMSVIPQFYGMDFESLYQQYLIEFELPCAIFIIRANTNEYVRLHLFPFSLKDKTKLWLNQLRGNSITTWAEIQSKFLQKFFLFQRTQMIQEKMAKFTKKQGESFQASWECFNELLNICPHNGYESWRVVNSFYKGLSLQCKQYIQTMCTGQFFDKEPNEALDSLIILQRVSANRIQGLIDMLQLLNL